MHAYIPPLSFATAAVAVYHLPQVLPPSTAAAVAQVSTAVGLFVLRSISHSPTHSSSTSSLQDRTTRPKGDKVPRDFLWTLTYIGALAGIGYFFKDQTRTSCFKAGTAIGLLQGFIHLCTPENPTSTPSSKISQEEEQLLASVLQDIQRAQHRTDPTSNQHGRQNQFEETDDDSSNTHGYQFGNNNNNNNNNNTNRLRTDEYE